MGEGGGGGTQRKKDTVTRAGKKKRSEKRVNNIELPKVHKKSYIPKKRVLTVNCTCSRGPSQIKSFMYSPALLASGQRLSKGKRKHKNEKKTIILERKTSSHLARNTFRAFLRSQKRLPGEVFCNIHSSIYLPPLPAYSEKKKQKISINSLPLILHHVSLPFPTCKMRDALLGRTCSIGSLVQFYCKSQ